MHDDLSDESVDDRELQIQLLFDVGGRRGSVAGVEVFDVFVLKQREVSVVKKTEREGDPAHINPDLLRDVERSSSRHVAEFGGCELKEGWRESELNGKKTTKSRDWEGRKKTGESQVNEEI